MNRSDNKMPPVEVAPSINLNLRQKLRNDREYRNQFFWAETSAGIARDLIRLRKRRGHSQKKLADLTGTKQPAISRIEQADYDAWNLSTLRVIANVEDARIRVIIEPAEDVLAEYDLPEPQVSANAVDTASKESLAGARADHLDLSNLLLMPQAPHHGAVDRSWGSTIALTGGAGKTGAMIIIDISSSSGGTINQTEPMALNVGQIFPPKPDATPNKTNTSDVPSVIAPQRDIL